MQDADAPTSVEEPLAKKPQPEATAVMSPVEVDSGTPERPSKCCKIRGMADDLAYLPVVEQHRGQWWDSAVKDSWGALPGAPAGGVDAAFSAWTSDLSISLSARSPRRRSEAECAPSEGGSRSRGCGLEGVWCVFARCSRKYRRDYCGHAMGFDPVSH